MLGCLSSKNSWTITSFNRDQSVKKSNPQKKSSQYFQRLMCDIVKYILVKLSAPPIWHQDVKTKPSSIANSILKHTVNNQKHLKKKQADISSTS